MSNYQTAFSAMPTIGGIVVSLAAAMTIPVSAGVATNISTPQIRAIDSGSTAGSLPVVSSMGYMGANADVFAAITDFYGKLSTAQKPLEPEFARVLFDNLWDLYAE